MVYESDFYTTRRYRTSPSLSTYTVSYLPSRQVRILPGLGKVHVVHTYDRIVPYVGHKRLTVVSQPPQVFSVRPSVLLKEFERIQYKYRPSLSYSYVNNYLNSDSAVRVYYSRYPITTSYSYYRPSDNYYHSVLKRPSRLYYDILGYPRWSRYWYRYWYDIPSTRYSDYYDLAYYPSSLSSYYLSPYWSKYWTAYNSPYSWSTYWTPAWSRYWRYYWSNYWSRWYDSVFNEETSRIRADAAGVLKRIHTPVIRTPLSLLPYNTRYSEPILSTRITSDDYIYKMLTASPHNAKSSYVTYYSEPVKKFVGPGRLAAVKYAWEKAYGRRPYHATYVYEDPIMSDIQLLSYYINKFRNDRALTGKEVSVPLSPARPSRHFSKAKIIDEPEKEEKHDYKEDIASIRMSRLTQQEVEEKLLRQKEDTRIAEERALAEEAARKQAQAKKEEAARKAELARQEELAAQAAAERAAEAERLAEQARLDELAKQAEIERIRQEEEERQRLEDERRLEELARAEEERQQLLRLEEIARQAEEERERELARQAEELAELARQEAELEEQARQEAETREQARREEELLELARQEEQLRELEKQEAELAKLAREEAEAAELARQDADIAKQEAELADLATQEAELEELEERQQAELDAIGTEAKELQQGYSREETVTSPTAAEDEEDAEEEDNTPAAEDEQSGGVQYEEDLKDSKADVLEEPDEPEEIDDEE